MLTREKHIISSCIISNNVVLKNSKQIFSSNAENIQLFLLSLYQHLNMDYPKFYKMDNLSKLGWLAAEILIKNENIKLFKPEQTGIVLMNANASLETDIKYFQTAKSIASPALFVYTLSNIVIGEICIRNNFKGETAFFVFEDFEAGFLEEYINDLFSNNMIQLCICGWVDVTDENYKAVLFLVSGNKKDNAVLFTKENMNVIFNSI